MLLFTLQSYRVNENDFQDAIKGQSQGRTIGISVLEGLVCLMGMLFHNVSATTHCYLDTPLHFMSLH